MNHVVLATSEEPALPPVRLFAGGSGPTSVALGTGD